MELELIRNVDFPNRCKGCCRFGIDSDADYCSTCVVVQRNRQRMADDHINVIREILFVIVLAVVLFILAAAAYVSSYVSSRKDGDVSKNKSFPWAVEEQSHHNTMPLAHGTEKQPGRGMLLHKRTLVVRIPR